MHSETIVYYLTFIPAIIASITLHEYAHARVALLFGDDTAYRAGRVSLNPLVHLDPIGTFGIFFLGFGWGRPVPVNPKFLRHPRADALVSAAGPCANFFLALVSAALLRNPMLMQWLNSLGSAEGAAILFSMIVHTNLILMCFNFIPLGPLDGAHVMKNLLPLNQGVGFEQFNQRYGYLILILLLLSDYFLPISPIGLLIRSPIQFLSSLLLGA